MWYATAKEVIYGSPLQANHGKEKLKTAATVEKICFLDTNLSRPCDYNYFWWRNMIADYRVDTCNNHNPLQSKLKRFQTVEAIQLHMYESLVLLTRRTVVLDIQKPILNTIRLS